MLKNFKYADSMQKNSVIKISMFKYIEYIHEKNYASYNICVTVSYWHSGIAEIVIRTSIRSIYKFKKLVGTEVFFVERYLVLVCALDKKRIVPIAKTRRKQQIIVLF